MRRSAGFTLFELLIAIVIGAILAAGTLYLVQVSSRTKETLVASNEYTSQLTRVVRVLASDLRQWSPRRPVRDAFGDQQEALKMDMDGLRLTRDGWALSRFVDLERSNLQRVSYRLAEPGSELCPWADDDDEATGEEGGCLIRSFIPHLDDDGRLEWRHQMLLRPVKAIQFRFLASVNGESDFYEAWPPDNLLDPNASIDLQAVEFSLETGEGDRLTRLIAVPRTAEALAQSAARDGNGGGRASN